MRCRLTLFGQPRLLDERQRLISVPAKTHALVAYLVMSRRDGPASRATLRELLWEDSDSKTAAANLRKFLSRIVERQQKSGFELIRNRRDHVELAESSVSIDLAEFQDVVARGGSKDLEALCNLYRGDLLEGIEWEGAEFRNWLHVQQTKLRDEFVSAVASRLEPFDVTADRIQVRVAAQRLREVDPYSEVAHRALMRLFAESGEPARVKEVYQSLQERLGQDLDVAPDDKTAELYRTLLPGDALKATPRPKPTAPARPQEPELEPDSAEAAEFAQADNAPAAVFDASLMPRVTVLPPPPIGGQDFAHQLAISLIEDVTIGLCRSKSLSMVAPHTASQLSRSNKRALLRSFGIDYVVETRLQNRGGELWLAVKLLNAVNRNILWVEQYRFDPSLMARQYRELSTQVVLLLVDTIQRAELARYEVGQDPTAYHLFLTGQRFLRILDLPHVRRARRAFKLAIGSSADFVPAISGLAHTFHLEWLLMARGDNELLREAEHLARRSLEIDPDDARGYRDLGLCNIYSGVFDESLEAFAQAERRNPQYADLLVDYADALQHSCEPSAALEKINRAVELNPLGPDRYWWTAGGANFHLQRYRQAIEAMSRMREASPAYRLLAASWALLGEREKAAEYVRKATEIHPDFNVSSWMSILPIRDRAFAQHYEQGLREAGFK